MEDFSVRITDPGKDEQLTFELHTSNIDVNDEGDAQDFGHPIIEGGTIVGDGTRNGYDITKIRHIMSLIEHAPDLESIVRRWLVATDTNADTESIADYARRTLADVKAGNIMYGITR